MRAFARSAIPLLAALQASSPVAAQETAYQGADAQGLWLRRLATTKRVLMIGAHPDDESTAVLASLALGEGADVAYLSLTRGDGGQNLIGPELQEGLGLIRSGELLAARRLDGARQYFTRAYDYGYSKSGEEAFRHWPRDSLLADVVAVVRRFRPDIVLTVWSGTPRDGHGQHQASGEVAIEAFDAAGNPATYPDQLAAGLRAYRTPYLMQAAWRPSGGVVIWLQTGRFDHLFGRSHFQIAMASRSLHRSQDQGSEQPPGPNRSALVPLSGPIMAGERSPFAGLDTTLSAIASRAVPADSELVAVLEAFQAAVGDAQAAWNPERPGSLLPHLGRALDLLDQAQGLAALNGESAADVRFRIAAERRDAERAIQIASGVRLDVTADDWRVVPGQSFELTARLWNGGSSSAVLDRLEPSLPEGWTASPLGDATGSFGAGGMIVRQFRVQVPPGAAVSEPYYLSEPRRGDMYVWPADSSVRGLPFAPDPVRAQALVRIDGRVVAIDQRATYVDVDKALGERRLPVLVVPGVSVRVDPPVAIVPLDGGAADGAPPDGTTGATTVSVVLRAEAPAGIEGRLRLEVPAGWVADPAESPVRVDGQGGRAAVTFRVRPPAGLEPGRHPVRAVFETPNGDRYDRGYEIIDYRHIEPLLLFRKAESRFSAFPVTVAPGLRIGYIEGAGDDGAAALRRLGLGVEMLTPELIQTGDLSGFDVIVAGIRAYEVRLDLIASNDRLLSWVEAGGTFIVQYNKVEFSDGGFAPYTLTIGQGVRVTDEDSPVRLLEPSHPVLSTPNRLGPADFTGWVQERGLYFAEQWDERYSPLLEMNDPGEPPRRGIVLVATHGRGHYAYVALSLFRQLPEGVPGAYRLLANLVSLGAR